MNFQGLIIGITAFMIIGIFHPIVIKSEYYFGKRVWPIFLLAGLLLIAISVNITNITVSAVTSITGFAMLWSIHEIFEQEKRVQKGWFPRNSKKDKSESK